MPNPIPVGYNDVLNTLIAWGQSGLKPNATVVKSYLPPVKDPQTGIEVLIPATTFKTADVKESRALTKKLMELPRDEDDVPSYNLTKLTNSWGEELPTINSLPSAPYAGSGIADFIINNDDPFGPQTFVGLRTVPDANLIEQVALTANGSYVGAVADAYLKQKKYVDSMTRSSVKADVLSGTMLSSAGGIGGLAKALLGPLGRTAAADRMAREVSRGLPRIIDRVSDITTMLEIPLIDPEADPPMVEIRTGKKDIDPDALPTGGKAFIPRRYDLKATRIPCAIPGVLNCIMTKYDTVDKTDKTYNYTPPKVGMYYVSDKDVRQADGTFADDGNTIRMVPIDPDAVDNSPLSIIVNTNPGGFYVEDIPYDR